MENIIIQQDSVRADMEKGADTRTLSAEIFENCGKRLLEMSSVTENNRIIPAIDKVDN